MNIRITNDTEHTYFTVGTSTIAPGATREIGLESYEPKMSASQMIDEETQEFIGIYCTRFFQEGRNYEVVVIPPQETNDSMLALFREEEDSCNVLCALEPLEANLTYARIMG